MFLSTLATVALLAPGAPAAEPWLADNGRSDYVIVVSSNPAPPDQTAAMELQSHLEQSTGARLPIVTEKEAAGHARQIVVGPSARLKELLPELDVSALGHDGIVMRTVGNHLVLAGQPPRGTLYAVYTFLEDVVGCRWWTSTESLVPRKPRLRLPALDVRYTPKLRYRESFYRDMYNGVFAARSKCNGNSNRISPEYGDHYRFAGFVHTFYPLLPPEKYFAAHPEWYSEIRGKRTHEHAQLCLTNEAMRAELTRNALALLKKDPGVGLISVSQNDWHGRCECAACKAVEDEEGSPAGPLVRFVNAVAADLEKPYPGLLVETLAYQYTRQPPRHVRPRGNVVIRLCSIECSFVQPLSGPQNEKFRQDIEGWSAIAPQLFIWDYVTNFSNYILPHPNLRVLAPNVRFFVDHKTVGLFEQGDYGSGVGDFIRLRAWLLAKLLWNPALDEKALIREFLAGYYGPAAVHLEAYLNVLHDAAERSGVFLKCFMPDTSTWASLEDLNAAQRHYDAASAAVAGDPVLASRVRRERMALDHAWLQRYYALARQARLSGKEFLGPKDPAALAAEFVRLGKEHRAGQFREGQAFAGYAPLLLSRFRPPAPLPAPLTGTRADDVIDVQDNEFRLARPGQWATIADDPAASDGKAARMPGDHNEWAVSWPVSKDFALPDPYRCYLLVRGDGKAAAGRAMTLGIYDTKAKKGIAHRTIKLEDLSKSGYLLVDLGPHRLNSDMYFWIAPPKDPEKVKAVYLDRIVLVRQKGEK